MAQNDLAPGFILLRYSSSFGSHKMTIPVFPNEDSGVWKLITRVGGSGTEWTSALDVYVALLADFLPSTSSIIDAELFTKDVEDAPVFREAYAVGVAGAHANAVVKASQLTMGFRTSEGGVGRVVLVDTSFAVNLRILSPYTGEPELIALSAYLVSDPCIVLGRDTTYPIATTKVTTKTNDALRKRYGMV